MMSIQIDSRLNSDILRDGEYYAFSKQKDDQIHLGYIYKTWCGSPYGTHMRFCAVQIGKPLHLAGFRDTKHDQGELKTFRFDSRNPNLIDDVYYRAASWLNKMQGELKYPQIDESLGCKLAIILVKQGVLYAVYQKDEFLRKYRLS